MSDSAITFLGTIVSALVTLAVCVITNRAAQKKTEALLIYRLEQLEKKVDKHNNLVERMYRVEEKTELQDQRLDFLEKAAGK